MEGSHTTNIPGQAHRKRTLRTSNVSVPSGSHSASCGFLRNTFDAGDAAACCLFSQPGKQKKKFSSFFKSLVIELDKDLYGPDNHLVEVSMSRWAASTC